MQLSPVLRKSTRGYSHWCPGGEEVHVIFDRWAFDGNVASPTFTPSVRISGKLTVKVRGEWTGEWVRDANGKAVDSCCHYNLTAGQIQFHNDCTHSLVGKKVPLPAFPDYLV